MTLHCAVSGLSRPRLTLCEHCAFWRKLSGRKHVTNPDLGRRSVTLQHRPGWSQKPNYKGGIKLMRKRKGAQAQWDENAKLVDSGKKPSMLTILESRGFVNSIAGDRDALDKLMNEKRIGAYAGVDPTAPSLHVGHLLPFMALFWLHIHGYHAVTLLGGSTSKVGDPTGRLTSRERQHSSIQKANMISMHLQMKKLWVSVVKYAQRHGYQKEWSWRRELVNNNAWWNSLPWIEVLRTIGQSMRLGTMLGRDTVQKRLESGDGMSFAEFTYPIMQAYDWWHMYMTKGVQLQIGGSDQFGNIVAGIDVIKYAKENHHDPTIKEEKLSADMVPYGLTVPLLTTASGAKFGKSAGNAVWLDPEMTTPFELYQFFLRSSDTDVERYLKLFTFIPLGTIEQIMSDHMSSPSRRTAQHILAREFVEMIHGIDVAKATEAQHRSLFRNQTAEPSAQPSDSTMSNSLNTNAPQANRFAAPSPNVTLPRSLVVDQPMSRVLYAAGLVASRSEGHRLTVNQGAYVGCVPQGGGGMMDQLTFSPVKSFFPSVTKDYIIEGDLIILRVGKWKVKVVKIVEDEDFEKQGLDAPGWKEFKRAKEMADASSAEARDETVARQS
ncbi:hypothetical protein L228DRAFT_216413 [Xylona heveae TC161]|uniref:Tyrosine--tRNA ligase n=1 Tax=Xylona heveae (strain CBS 132557 / TC161) TaxID=1328760 RepID=A0A165JHL8_XYLHT|nr:hypothetical protein L228DRAFT_216413 [Xylona heveae TC161]KZF26252.1 hypothetical protein L228DRAFT_216413 [Xylona heveae TC161]